MIANQHRLMQVCGCTVTLCGFLCGFLLPFSSTGCSSSTVKKAVAKAKSQVQATTQAATTAAAAVGAPTTTNFSLTVNKAETPLVITAGKAEVAVVENRPVLVQFVSMAAKGGIEHPKLMVWVHTESSKAEDMVGKSHSARVFMQMKPGHPVFATSREKPAKVLIESRDDTHVTAKLEAAELIDATGQEIMNVTGTLVGLIPQPPPPPKEIIDPKTKTEKKKVEAE